MTQALSIEFTSQQNRKKPSGWERTDREHKKLSSSVEKFVFKKDRCLNCRSCEIACTVSKSGSLDLLASLAEAKLPVRRIRVIRECSGSEAAFGLQRCHHCVDAPCAEVCRFHAIRWNPATRTVVIDESRCTGCRRCVRACLFGAITMVRTPEGRSSAVKCTNCEEHVAGPACVRACPTKALVLNPVPRHPPMGRETSI